MVSLNQTKAGGYVARKGIPLDVRDDYKRLYGQRREAIFSCPSGTSKAEAKAQFGEWLAREENRIDSLRRRARGEGISLTRKEALGLAGEWYCWFIGKHQAEAENDKEAELKWWTVWSCFLDELEDLAPPWFQRATGRTWDDWRRWIGEEDDPVVKARMRAIVADFARSSQFLSDKGLVLAADARDFNR